MGFTNASGEEVTFDVVDDADGAPRRARRRRPRSSSTRRASGGSVDINVVTGVAANPSSPTAQNYLDVVYQAPAGASLDYALDHQHERRTSRSPAPGRAAGR